MTLTELLTEFLLARIADTETVAKAAAGTQWMHDGDGDVSDSEGAFVSHPTTVASAQHIADWDPARVLAECEAKRRIVEMALGAERARAEMSVMQAANPDSDEAISALALLAGGHLAAEGACRVLAVPYADHPDFREEWRA